MSSGKPKEQAETIEYIGVSDLKAAEQETVHAITEEYAEKFKKSSIPFNQLIVHIKIYNTEGQRRKYSVRVRLIQPKNTFESKTDDWDLSPVMHQVFEEIVKQMHHKLHTDVTRPR